MVFNGRVAEDFKLTQQLHLGQRGHLARPGGLGPGGVDLQDVEITGHDRSEVGALASLSGSGRAKPPAEMAETLCQAWLAPKAEGGGFSQTPSRALRLPDAAQAAAEIIDKGYVNQCRVLSRRAAEVLALHAEPADPRVVRRAPPA